MERTREFGVMRAIGARAGTVRRIVVGEGAFIALDRATRRHYNARSACRSGGAMRELLGAAVLVFSLCAIACDTANPAGPSELSSTVALITALRQNGATVVRGDVLPRESNPFFSTNAHVLFVNTGHVNVFEYATLAAAESDAAKVSPDGSSVGSTMITWIGPPHFYKKDRLIVVYAGSADDVLRPLEAVLGPPFARR